MNTIRFMRWLALSVILQAALLGHAPAQVETTSATASPNKQARQEKESVTSFGGKDWAALVVSVLALTVSALSFFQKIGETSQTRRKQLTDVLQKLSDLNTEIEKFRSLKDKKDYPVNYTGLIDDQRRFLVRQAAYISRAIKGLVSPYEYLVMAGVFDGINDLDEAERFFKIASTAKHAFDRGVALRGYARFLFLLARQAEARDLFQKSIDSFNGETDRHKGYRGVTYERWAILESEWSHLDEAAKRFTSALAEFQSISNPLRRESEVARLKQTVLPYLKLPDGTQF